MHCIFSKASLTMIMGILVIVVIDKNITVEADHHHHSLPPPFSPPLPIPPTFIDALFRVTNLFTTKSFICAWKEPLIIALKVLLLGDLPDH